MIFSSFVPMLCVVSAVSMFDMSAAFKTKYEVTGGDIEWYKEDDSIYYHGFFEVVNTSDDIINLTFPCVEVEDKDGKLVQIDNESLAAIKGVLSPGESTYFYTYEDIELRTDAYNPSSLYYGAKFTVETLNSKPYEYDVYSDNLILNKDKTGADVLGRFKNDSAFERSCAIGVVVKDQDGVCIGLSNQYAYVKAYQEYSFDVPIEMRYADPLLVDYDALSYEIVVQQIVY